MRKHVAVVCLTCLLVLSAGCIGDRAKRTYKDDIYLEWASPTVDLLLADIEKVKETAEDDPDVQLEAFKKLYDDASKALEEEKEFPQYEVSLEIRHIWEDLHYSLEQAKQCGLYGEKCLTDPSEWNLENYAKYKTRLDECLSRLDKDIEEL